MKKYICIHGHFYQPPRENPWTGEVDKEDSAAPFHDWNERICKECYEANTKAEIFNDYGEVKKRVNNFTRISFDMGPTLLSWMRRKAPGVYQAIIDADRESVAKHGGHGNAMAQVYNHIIMPLASRRDKITQVYWGVKDFEFHFKRKPEGMWLSESAVDKNTLSILAEHGIKFTILAPHQIKRIRHVGFGARWEYIRHESVDNKHAYRVILEQGKQFSIFIYNAGISRAIAFEGLLYNGDQLDARLMNAFGNRDREQLVSTATDGESFGHHHKNGEMAIAYGLEKIQEHHLAYITNYAAYLDRFDTFWEADIHENSSWSCAHGVERWRSDCGCRINQADGWNQKWRTPLRDAFDFLKEAADDIFEKQTKDLLKDPWQARNDYIQVMLEPTFEKRKRFLLEQSKKSLSDEEQKKIWNLLEAQKFALFMYTSCGWFFDDVSGIEPVYNMKCAARTMELTQAYAKQELEPAFLKILRLAESNIEGMGNGEEIFRKFVKRS